MVGGGRNRARIGGFQDLRSIVAPRFDDPEVEAAFRRDRARETLPMVRAGFLVGIALWAVVGVILPQAVSLDATVLHATVAAMVAVDAISLLVLRGTPSLGRIDAIGIASSIGNAIAVLVLTAAAPSAVAYAVPGLMLTVLYAVAVFRTPMPGVLLSAGAILVAFLLGAAPRLALGEAVFGVFLLGAMMAIGMIGVVMLDRSSRDRFSQRRTIEAQREEVARERAKSDALLRSILPAPIAARLREQPGAVAERLEPTTLLFADLVGFTALAERLGPQRTAALLNTLVSRWDVLATEAGVEKIKTIGDAYFAAAGVPEPQADHARRIVDLGFSMIRVTTETGRAEGESLAIRVGVHSGPVVAGVIGRTKFSYDLWGDTVNVASRLESTGVAGEIQASAATVQLLDGAFDVVPRGEVAIKGKGPMATFFVRPRGAPSGAAQAPRASSAAAPTSPSSSGAEQAQAQALAQASRGPRRPGGSVQSEHD